MRKYLIQILYSGNPDRMVWRFLLLFHVPPPLVQFIKDKHQRLSTDGAVPALLLALYYFFAVLSILFFAQSKDDAV